MSGGLRVCEVRYLVKTLILAAERMPNPEAQSANQDCDTLLMMVPMILYLTSMTPHILARSLMGRGASPHSHHFKARHTLLVGAPAEVVGVEECRPRNGVCRS